MAATPYDPLLRWLCIREAMIRMLLIWVLCVAGPCGCRRATESFPANVAASASLPSGPSVVAQGQILPAKGLIQLFAQPGDPVLQLHVKVGAEVTAGQPLATMRSSELNLAQQQTLREQRSEALSSQQAAVDLASQRVAAAELRVAQLASQAASLERRDNLLELAEQQVAAAHTVLQRLEKIASNPQTSEFVGLLDIERQRIEVREAELLYQEQTLTREQAADELGWAQRLARSEVQAAQSQLAVLQRSSAPRVLDLQLAAIQVQGLASTLTAPSAGTILAIYASEGESSLQQPILEMADLSKLVCEVEINAFDAARVQANQRATIRSRALNKPLTGHVTQTYPLVGRPQLRALDPLAPADYHTVTATIELDPGSLDDARNWLRLQVEVTIETDAGETDMPTGSENKGAPK